MMKKIFTILVMVSSFMFCYAVTTIQDGLNGKWSGEFKTPDGGEYPITYNFKEVSGTLAGVATFPKGTIENGKVNGTDFTFVVPAYGSPIMHTGKYYSQADSIGIDMDFNGKKLHATLKRDTQ